MNLCVLPKRLPQNPKPTSQPEATMKSTPESKAEEKTEVTDKATQTIAKLLLKSEDMAEVAPTFVTVEEVPMTPPVLVEIGAEGGLRGVVVS